VPAIRPFAAVRYAVPDGELGRVLAPPYDVIPPAYQRELYARDPRNVVRLVLNDKAGEAGYREVAETYARWRAEGLLASDPEPALYLLEQEFALAGERRRRRGLLARFRAEDPATRAVLPHEHTRPGPREDRYRVLLATRANFSPIFLMFPDAGRRFQALAGPAAAGPPLATYTDDAGVAHRLWRLADSGTVAGAAELLGGVTAYIADGHHRYACALRYREEFGPEGAWTLGYFTPLEDGGLCVLPYHRLLAAGPSLPAARGALVAKGFRVAEVEDAKAAAARVARSSAAHAFGLAAPQGGALVAEAGAEQSRGLAGADSLRALDTFFFHEAVLGPLLGVAAEAVRYVHSFEEAEKDLAAGACRLAVLMRGTPLAQIVAVAEAGESMPAKSTFFHPKLPSGLLIHELPPGRRAARA
jgi:uncharacterized protein (DUF1015 family)